VTELPDWPIAQHAQTAPDDLAMLDRGTPYTFRDYAAAINRCAAALVVPPGERVGLCLEPSFASLCLLQALWLRGAVALPISTRLPSERVTALVAELGLSALFTAETMPAPAAAAALTPPPPRDVDAPAAIVLSSGSSAQAKAIVHSYASLAYNALGANANMPIQRGDRWLLSLPLYHVSGLGILFRTALAGATVVIDDAPDWIAAIRTHHITHLSVVSTQLAQLVEAWEGGGACHSLKAVLAGGSHIPAPLVARACDLGIPLHLSYGSTEMGSQITTTRPDDGPEGLTTSGRLLAHRTAIVDDEGEILVKGQTLCLGVLRDGTIVSCCDSDGWFHTGDSGWFDDNGQLRVTGRRDRMFISGGENIYPEEIEAALLDLPEINEAAVVGIPDPTYGARPVAFVKMTTGLPRQDEQLRIALATVLPAFKHPDKFMDWPSHYPSGGLKVDRVFLLRHAMALMGDEADRLSVTK